MYMMHLYVADWDNNISACCSADLVHILCSSCQSARLFWGCEMEFIIQKQEVLKHAFACHFS